MGIYSGSGSPHVACNTEPLLARFFILICREHKKTCPTFFLAQCHHGVCSVIVDHPLTNIILGQKSIQLAVSFHIFDDVRNAYAKKCGRNPSGRQFSTIFVGGVSMSCLKGERVGNYPQQKLISKNLWQEVERVSES